VLHVVIGKDKKFDLLNFGVKLTCLKTEEEGCWGWRKEVKVNRSRDPLNGGGV
jgi:hypothetical protein